MGTTALAASGLTAAPAAAETQYQLETVTLDFSNGLVDSAGNTWSIASGGNTDWNINDGVLSITQDRDWQGLQTPPQLIENGVQYAISASVRWAPPVVAPEEETPATEEGSDSADNGTDNSTDGSDNSTENVTDGSDNTDNGTDGSDNTDNGTDGSDNADITDIENGDDSVVSDVVVVDENDKADEEEVAVATPIAAFAAAAVVVPTAAVVSTEATLPIAETPAPVTSGEIRWVTSDNGDSAHEWVGNANIGQDWDIIAGTFTRIGLANPVARLNGGVAGTFLVESVTVSRYVPIESGDAPIFSTPAGEVVRESNLTNGDGSWNWDLMSHGGHTAVTVDGAPAWQLGRADWSGIFDTNNGGGHFPMVEGETYLFEVSVRAAAGFDGAQINLGGHPGSHISNVNVSENEWTVLSGEIVAGADNQQIRATTGVENMQLLVRAARLTLLSDDTDGGTTPPVTGETVVWSRDFEDGVVAGGDGGQFEVVPNPIGEGNVQRIVTAASWHGTQIPAGTFEQGATYRFQADVLRPEGSAAMNARFEGANDPWPWVVGNHAMSDTEWSTISGEFTWDEIAPMPVRLVNGGDGAFYADNIIITRLGTAPEITEPEFERELVARYDFEDAADILAITQNGGPALAVVANPDGEGNVLRVTGTDNWRAPMVGTGLLQAGAGYVFVLDARMEAGFGAGQILFRENQTWASGGGDHAITDNSWTTVTSNTHLAGQGSEMQIQATEAEGAASRSYYLDNIEIWRVSPAPEIDTEWEFDGAYFDFEDGEAQGWFGRNTTSSLATGDPLPLEAAVVSPGANGSDYAFRVSNRDSQGDGPMLDVVELLAPMRRFQVSGYARFIDRAAGNGTLTLSIQTGSGTFTNLATGIQVRNNEWTHFDVEFMMPAFTNMANLYFETPWQSGEIGDTSTFEIDSISIQLPAPISWERDLIPLSATLPGIHTGIAVDTRELSGEHSELLLHHFNHLVGENHMKPESWFAGGGFDTFRMHDQARAILDFAVEHNLTVFGHVLVWHSQTPSWFFSRDGVNPVSASNPELTNSPADQEIMLDRMRTYIRLVAEDISTRYGLFGSDGNPVNSYEVANEVVAGNLAQGALAGGMRPNSPWTRIFYVEGEPNSAYRFVREAFEYADQVFNGEFHVDGTVANPAQGANRVTLWVNDYNTERGTGTPDN
ncbi:MAG: carbohydrate binding domain-containing protein, partial [Cellulomonadaceae bacterium]|nr:carbohydrate binding domain-containing protein [Cellulomonadaceae bacterium]